jgi:hypothetical protein
MSVSKRSGLVETLAGSRALSSSEVDSIIGFTLIDGYLVVINHQNENVLHGAVVMAFGGNESMCALLRITGSTDHVSPLNKLPVFLTDKSNCKGYAFASRIQSVKQESHPFVGKHPVWVGAKIETSHRLSVVYVITFVEKHTFVLLIIEQRYVNVRRVLRRVL